MNLPDLDAMMLYWIKLLKLDQPDPVSGKPWKITWAWADRIPHPDGGEAVGLNQGDGRKQASNISIRKPQSEAELADLEDTICHEVNHCIDMRMKALWEDGLEAEGHEYHATTAAQAMVKIKGTPKAKSLAKALRTLPARAKGPRMDTKAILAMLAMIDAASTPEEKAKLLAEMKAQLEAVGGEAAPPSTPALGAEPPKPEPMAAPALTAEPPPALGMGEPERYKKLVTDSIDALVEMRPDLTPEQKAHVKGLSTVEAAKTYFKAHPMATKITPAPQLGIPAIPRGGEDTTKAAPSGDKHTMRLFRIMPGQKSELPENSGVQVFDPKSTGKLVQFSVVDAYNTIRANTEQNIELAKAKRVSA